jgi:hypothetical protein
VTIDWPSGRIETAVRTERAGGTLEAVTSVLGLYALWVLTTYLLEGAPGTLLRPEAHGLRLTYTVIANLTVGTLSSMLVLRRVIAASGGRVRPLGFGSVRRAVLASVLGLALGGGVYVARGAPSLHPVILVNGLAQVLPVSVAEVLVCWALVGVVAGQSWARGAGPLLRGITMAIVASVAFGLYHIAHSPPFNTPGMIGLLTLVGVVTSVFFVTVRDVYGTIAFHNFLALFGVLQALAARGALGHYEAPHPTLLATAVVALGLLIATHVRLIGSARPL